jgi:hypothetical protein
MNIDDIKNICVVGAGNMGHQISTNRRSSGSANPQCGGTLSARGVRRENRQGVVRLQRQMMLIRKVENRGKMQFVWTRILTC